MLCMNTYPRKYVDQCRQKMEAQIAAYRGLVKAGKPKAGASSTAFDSAVSAFEPQFFNNLVVVLDGYFVHRSRALELKDGNPLNEVRMICNSVLQNNGVLAADKSIKYNPDKAVTKLKIGDEIQLTEATFAPLFKAFFADIDAKFV